jgi:hypothetical protein
LQNFINHRTNTNILALAAPHRHDLQETSCINKEVHIFNRKLLKIFKARDVTIIDIKLHRNDFTQHELHLNTVSKEKVAEMIAENIKQLRVKKIIFLYLLMRKVTQKMCGQNSMKPSPMQRSTRTL